jgi:hypothetical protein
VAKLAEAAYQPDKYWRDDSVFIGLDPDGEPLYCPLDDWRESQAVLSCRERRLLTVAINFRAHRSHRS